MTLKALILSLFISITAGSVIAQETANGTDTLGNKILTIQYKLKASKADSDIFEDGIMPWMNLENPGKQIDSLIGADEIVLPFKTATLIIDYPLNSPASFQIVSAKAGFTRKELILLISEKYHDIYKTEEQTTETSVIPVDKRVGIINRNATNGKYGICCHDLGDLDLSAVEIFKTPDGKISLLLEIES